MNLTEKWCIFKLVFMRSAVAWDYLMLLNRLWTRVLASWICFTLWTKEEMEPSLLWDILLYFNDNLFILRKGKEKKIEIIVKTEDRKKERMKEIKLRVKIVTVIKRWILKKIIYILKFEANFSKYIVKGGRVLMRM